MDCKLSQDDCAEIYHALGRIHAANLQARIGFEGEVLARGDGLLFRGDAQTIYRAVMDERRRVLEGAYDSFPGEVNRAGSVPFRLAERLERILSEIGPDGRNLNAALHSKAV